MSLNIGGLYVGWKEGLSETVVADAITAYWTRIGARPMRDGDPLDIPPLSLKKTARLGFAIAPPGEDERGDRWLAVYDSERYNADPALARHLAESFGVPVVFYEVSGASGSYAYVKIYGKGGPTPPKSADTQEWLEGFPQALVYFNQLKAEKGVAETFRVLGFEAVPYRPNAKYSGPSPDEQRELDAEAQMSALAEARDAKGIKALGARHPDAMLPVLQNLEREDQSTEDGRAFVSALAEDALATNSDLYAIAENAIRTNDERVLARALEAMGTRGYLWGLLESRAAACSQRGETEIAFRLLHAVCEGPSPSLTSWNNYAYELAKLPRAARPPVGIVKPILERALHEAPMNVPIFHNVACAAVALGLYDFAIEAVRGAARHGYERLAEVREDPDLAAIASDPRFVEVFAAAGREIASTSIDDLEKLVLRLPIKAKPHIVHRAVFAMTFYFAEFPAAASPAIRELLDAYLADIPPGALRFYKRGHFKPLKKAMLTKERNNLAAPKDGRYLRTLYRSTDGDAAEYEFHAEGEADGRTAYVEVAFPLAEARDPDALYARFVRYATRSGCESAHAGFAARNREHDAYEGIYWDRKALDARFLGMQSRISAWSPGRTPPAHWLVWLSPRIAAKLGGAALAQSIGDAKLEAREDGVAIRAAGVPPIAPVANPDDRGAIPDVARALAPLRIQTTSSSATRLARWDALPGASYENGARR